MKMILRFVAPSLLPSYQNKYKGMVFSVKTAVSFIIEKLNRKRLMYNWLRILLPGIKETQIIMENTADVKAARL